MTMLEKMARAIHERDAARYGLPPDWARVDQTYYLDAVRAALMATRELDSLGPVLAAGQWSILGPVKPCPPVRECAAANVMAKEAFTAMIDAILNEKLE